MKLLGGDFGVALFAAGLVTVGGAVVPQNGADVNPLLSKVQERRMFPTRVIQSGQKMAQDRFIGRLLQGTEPIRQAPLVVRLFDRFPLLRRIPGRIIGLGVRREHVNSPLSPRAR